VSRYGSNVPPGRSGEPGEVDNCRGADAEIIGNVYPSITFSEILGLGQLLPEKIFSTASINSLRVAS